MFLLTNWPSASMFNFSAAELGLHALLARTLARIADEDILPDIFLPPVGMLMFSWVLLPCICVAMLLIAKSELCETFEHAI